MRISLLPVFFISAILPLSVFASGYADELFVPKLSAGRGESNKFNGPTTFASEVRTDDVEVTLCGGLPPAWSEAYFQLIPWSKSVEKKIRENQQFQAVEAKLVSELRQNEIITCIFRVNEEGHVIEMKTLSVDGSESKDPSVEALICAAAPFEEPPNLLPVRDFMRLAFLRIGKTGGWVFTPAGSGIPVTRRFLQSLEASLWSSVQRRKALLKDQSIRP